MIHHLPLFREATEKLQLAGTGGPTGLRAHVRGEWALPFRWGLVGASLEYPDPETVVNVGRNVKTRSDLLERFLKIGDRRSASIQSFARKYGPLYLCSHGLPVRHGRCALQRVQPVKASRAGTSCYETVEQWQALAERALAVLLIAASLRSKGRQAPRYLFDYIPDFVLVGDSTGGSRGGQSHSGVQEEQGSIAVLPSLPMSPANQRHVLASEIENWLSWGAVRLKFVWEEGEPSYALEAGDLVGALALSLAVTVARSDSLHLCTGCRTLYTPRRTPNPDRRKYCPSCRKAKIPQRDAAREYRRRKQSAE